MRDGGADRSSACRHLQTGRDLIKWQLTTYKGGSVMKTLMNVITMLIILMTIVSPVSVAVAEEGKKMQQTAVMLTPAEIMWVVGPASLPPGAQFAVMEGDPKSPGMVTMRLKLPPHYKLQPHTHPADERVTVISGTLYFALGEEMDASKAKALTAGSFFVVPPKTGMFGFTKDDEAVIQLNVMGPWGVTYFNPADDPRKK
ncbi:MAG: DUF4437 domain-containing protein [Nitrospiraceae bacterium]|nr:MAG: DUF4437 domain-containing protein [Nitrospiraceae bacterium]